MLPPDRLAGWRATVPILVRSESKLREQGGLVPQGAVGRDEGPLDGDDGDGQNLGATVGRGHSGQQPRQFQIVSETDDVLLGQAPPVTGPAYPAKGQVGGQV